MSSIRLTSPQRLLRAIQVKNPSYVFEMADVTFGLPIVLEGHESGKHTSVLVTATVSSSRYILEQTVYYDRNDLSVLFTEISGIDGVPSATDADFIARVNELFGMALTEDDVYVVEYENANGLPPVVTLRAKPDSLGFIGEAIFDVTYSKIPLYVAIAQNVLDGLEYPDVVLSAPLVVEPSAAVNPVAEDPAAPGTMLTGTGNPSTGFFKIDDGRLELAITARRWKSGAEMPVVDDVVQISVTETDDWNIPFSVACYGALAGERPTDHYDIQWRVTNLDTSEEMIWELRESVINDGNLDWVCITHAMPGLGGNTITDNDEAPGVVQNIQRVSFYRNAFALSDMLSEEPRGYVGNFEIALSSRVKDALSNLQEVVVPVHVFRAA